MAKKLNIDMNINANVSQASSELKKLQSLLNEVISSSVMNSSKMKITKEISEATQAAVKLKSALAAAINQDTGNLDLSKFSQQLSKSQTSLKDYSNQLLKLGPTGEKAFLQMAKAVASAETPLRKTNGLVSELWTTMKNTARWQLSSSALHSFIGTMKGAVGYAENLNKSLNNIRIVTGANTEEMAKFAEEANKAAKSLSTTTTAYTDAALIYYQQGLSDEAVKSRTEATVKLANVSRQSAEEVSSQMTAIWNNFAKGSTNLEYYADVITALGAATASSSDEIAQGLSKFASVADTVGLSYEKATASLATVVAETRQSADVVGTAFKTIFARIEGLSLGKTLEDGVDLNKYSKALETVGVNILDSNKQLKNMDTVLDELYSKWTNISEAQKIALAETVAGTRQYTQFLALMNNYNKVQKNETIAENSEGTLQKQADTYAESWEAAEKRVKAAAEGLYQELLNDKFFIDLNNAFAGVLEGITKFTKTLGGLPGILSLLGTVVTSVFKNQIALSIDNAVHNLTVFFNISKDQARGMRADLNQIIDSFENIEGLEKVQVAENNLIKNTNELVGALAEKKEKLLEQDYEELKLLTEITEQYGEQAIEAAKKAEQADEQARKARQGFTDEFVSTSITENDDQKGATEYSNTANDIAEEINAVVTSAEAGKAIVQGLKEEFEELGNIENLNSESYEIIRENLNNIKNACDGIKNVDLPDYLQRLNDVMSYEDEKTKKLEAGTKLLNEEQAKLARMEAEAAKAGKLSAEEESKIADQRKKVENITKTLEKHEAKLAQAKREVAKAAKEVAKKESEANETQKKSKSQVIDIAKKHGATTKEEIKAAQNYGSAVAGSVQAQNKAIITGQNYNKMTEETKKAIKDAASVMADSFGKNVVTTFQGISQISMGINSLKGAFDVLNNTDMSFGEKFLSLATSLGMAIPSLISGINNLKSGIGGVAKGFRTGAEALALHLGLTTKDQLATEKLSFSKLKEAINIKIRNKAIEEGVIAEEGGIIVQGKGIISTIASTIAKGSETGSRWANVAAIIAEETAMSPLLVITLLLVAAMAALALAIAGIVLLAQNLSNAYNKDAMAAERAEDAAKNLAETYKTTKEEYDKLKQTITDHQSALDSIESLTKGTREWKDAIREANEKAKELITTYGLAKDKDYTIDENGLIKFNEGVEEDLLNKEADKVAVADAASTMAAQRAKEARAKSDLTDLKREQHHFNGWSVVGTYAGGLVGGVTAANQAIHDAKSDATIDEAVKRLTEGDLAEAFKNNTLTKDDLSEKLNIDDKELIKSIEKLAKSINDNTEAEEASYQMAAESLVAEDENVQDSKYKEELTSASGKIYEQLEKDSYDKYKSMADSRDGMFSDYGNDDSKKAMKMYAEAMGLDKLDGYEVTNYKQNGKIEYKYKDENGDEKKKEVTSEEIASVLAANDASEELSEAMEKLETTITGLDISNNKSNQAVIDFLANGNMSKSTYAEAQDLQKDTNIQQRIDEAGEIKSLSEFGDLAKNIHDDTKKYLMESLDITDEDAFEEKAKELGYKSGDAFVSEFNKQQSNIKKEWDKITIDDRGLDNIEDMSLESAKKLQSTLEDIDMGPTGKKAGEDYINGINKMLEGVSSKDMSKAQDALAAIDWSSWDALKQADKTLQQFNVDIDTSSEEWKEWAAEMRIAAGATPDFAQMKADIADVTNTLSKLDFGKTISDADYQKLISSGSDEWKQYFQAQADGTMKFIGNVEELKKANQDQIKDMETTLQKRKELQEKFNELDFTYTDDDTGKTKNVQWDKLKHNTSRKEKAEIADQLLSNEDSKKVLEELGYDEETIRENIRLMVEEDDAAARHYINEMYERIGEFQEEKNEENIQQTKDMYAATAETLNELADMYSEGVINEEAYNKQLTVFAMSAKSLQELQTMVSDYGLSADTYSNALINLAGNYDNCTNELLEYQKALASGSTELATSTQALLENAIAIGEMSAALDLETEEVEEQAKELISVNGLSEENYKIASKVAILNQSMNKGVSTLVDNWSEYKKTLQSAQKGTEDYAEAALNTKKALSSLLGVLDEDYIPDDFLELPGVMDLIDKATEGDEDAINQLGTTMAKATIEALEFKEGLEGIDGVKLTSDEFENYKNEVLEGITSLTEAITNGTLQAGDDITTLMDGTGQSWINSLNEMAYATGMSVDEMKSLLNELGVEAEVVTKDKEVETQVPEYTTYEADLQGTTDENSESLGGGYKPIKKSVTVQTSTKKVKGSISVAQINVGDENKGKTPTVTYAGRDNVSSSALEGSSSSSSDSSSSKTTSAASQTHTVNRYTEEENQINGLTKQYERLSKAKDDAYGMNKVKAIEKEIQKLEELSKASEDYLDTLVGEGNAEGITQAVYNGEDIGKMISSGNIGGTVKADYNSMFSGYSASGKQLEYTAKDSSGNQYLVSQGYSLNELNSMFGTSMGIQLDSYGNVSNKDALYKQIEDLENAENVKYASYADPTAEQTTDYNKRIAYLKEFKERIEQYGTTASKIGDQVDENLKYIQQLQEKNAELIQTKMNTDIELSKDAVKRMERTIKILGNDIYKSTEKMAKYFDIKLNKNQNEYKKQDQSYKDASQKIKEGVEKYQKNPLDKEGITPEKAAEMMQTIEDGYDDLYESQMADIQAMQELYGNTVDEWKTKITEVTSAMEFNINTLNHLQKVYSLLGKSQDYTKIGKILEAQVSASKTDYNTKKALADKATEKYNEHKTYYDSLTNEKEREQYKKSVLDKDRETMEEYVKQEQAAFETYIQQAQALHENNVKKIYQQYEDNLTGEYGSFSNLDQAMKNQKALTEEYLTKTNQLYETNKMLRTLNQDIDKTSNRAAKERLKAFSDEIDALQKKEKLTKNDLELAKSKYEVLKAQIALEEAQEAKSTVRLQRDNEGNYGYVYTADQDKVANAEQNLEDKENDYYNLALKQYNDYAEKELQLRQEYQSQKENLDKAYYEEHSIDEKQYLKSLEELNANFREKELICQEVMNSRGTILDQIAATDRTEAWASHYEDTLVNQQLFNDESTGAAQTLNEALKTEMEDWNTTRESLLTEAGLDNENFAETIKTVTTEVDNLGKQITKKGGLVDQYDEMTSKAEKLTAEFAAQYEKLLNTANGYLEAANQASQYRTELALLTTQQQQYNAAVAAQPSSNTGSSNNQTPTSNDTGTKGGSNTDTSNGINNNNNNNNNNNGGSKKKSNNNSSDSLEAYSIILDFITKNKLRKGDYNRWGQAFAFGGVLDVWNSLTSSQKEVLKNMGYKSGGYTGSWNGNDTEENGKLAFLHQKELVLNADDTENILSAVKLIRQISQAIDLQAMNQSTMLQTQNAMLESTDNILQQEVTIHAEFPNVSNSSEIEKAFENLVNRASQFANRV